MSPSDEITSTGEIPESNEVNDFADDEEPSARLLSQLNHLAATGPNYILVNCFTGYGKKSLVNKNVYLYTASQLNDWDLCKKSIDSEYTLSKLAAANQDANKK